MKECTIVYLNTSAMMSRSYGEVSGNIEVVGGERVKHLHQPSLLSRLLPLKAAFAFKKTAIIFVCDIHTSRP